MKDIEIVQWVKFNKPNIREEIKELADKCNTKMDFLRSVKEKYNLNIVDANVVVNNFFKK